MANYSNLKAAIAAAIKTNGNQEITGQVLQDVLTSIVSVIGANYTFAGVATPATNPGTPDQNVAYFASQAGTYTNFGAVVLPAGIHLLMWNGAWTEQTFFVLDDVPTAGSNNLVKSGGVAKSYDGLTKFCHFLDIIDGAQYGKYWSAGGVLSDAAFGGFFAKELDVSSFIGKSLIIRCGWSGNLISGCYFELSNGSFLSLSKLCTYSFDNQYMTCIIPQNALKLEITYRIENNQANKYFVAVNENINAVSRLENSNIRYIELSDIQSGYWQSGGVIGVPGLPEPFIAGKIDLTNLSGKKLRIAAGGGNASQPLYDLTSWCFVKYSNGNYKSLIDVAFTDTKCPIYAELYVTNDMVELQVSVRLNRRPYYFVAEEYDSPRIDIPFDFYALGDSTTFGAGEGGSNSTNGNISWTDHLISKANFNSYNKIAVNSTLCMDDGTHPKLATQIAQVPDNSLVTVMIGTNDINLNMPLGDVDSVLAMSSESLNDTTNFAMAFRMNMENLIKNCPHSVILCMMPVSPLGTTLQGTGYLEPNPTLRQKVEQYANVERKICNYLSIPIIETMSECGITPYAQTLLLVTSDITSDSFMADNYHPNGAGNEKIANYMLSRLTKYQK